MILLFVLFEIVNIDIFKIRKWKKLGFGGVFDDHINKNGLFLLIVIDFDHRQTKLLRRKSLKIKNLKTIFIQNDKKPLIRLQSQSFDHMNSLKTQILRIALLFKQVPNLFGITLIIIYVSKIRHYKWPWFKPDIKPLNVLYEIGICVLLSYIESKDLC